MELQQLLMIKKFCIDSNYFRELLHNFGALYSPSGANKSSRIAK
jgi:hypothetical protein